MEHGILLSGADNIDFMIHGVFKYSFFGHEVWITTTHVCVLIVMLLIIGFVIAANRQMAKAREVPEGFQNVVELIVEKLDAMVDTPMGKAAPKFYNYIGTIFIFILVSNISGLLGLRLDITPTSYFTFGASRISMLGGKGNGLDSSDWGNWVTGTNADSHDKWDDIAGFDARLRLPGVQFYGELYGEDQANYLPSQVGYRAGMYIPNLAGNGSWDLTMETAKTGHNWYYHGRYQNGWTYHGQIMGDQMGPDAQAFFAKVNHYWTGERSMGIFVKRTSRNHEFSAAPTDTEVGVTGQYKVSPNTYLNGELGLSHGTNQLGSDDKTNSTFVNLAMTKMF